MSKHKHSISKREEEISNQLEEFIKTVKDMIIFVDKPEEEIENAYKVVEKAIKDIRNGKGHKVFNYDNNDEFFEDD